MTKRKIHGKKFQVLVIITLLSLVIMACGQAAPPPDDLPDPLPTDTSPADPEPTEEPMTEPSTDYLVSKVDRVVAPQLGEGDLDALVGGNSAFALELYQGLRSNGGNLFYSPFSISQALAMTYAGARAETEGQMADVLHFDLIQERLHPTFNGLDLELSLNGASEIPINTTAPIAATDNAFIGNGRTTP